MVLRESGNNPEFGMRVAMLRDAGCDVAGCEVRVTRCGLRDAGCGLRVAYLNTLSYLVPNFSMPDSRLFRNFKPDHSSALIPIKRFQIIPKFQTRSLLIPHPSSLVIGLAQGRSVRSPNVSILLMCYWAFRKPRAGALGSLTECPLDIRPCGVRVLTRSGPVCSTLGALAVNPLKTSRLKTSNPHSYQQGRSVRAPNVSILLMCYWAFRKPRAGALGSLTECPLDIRPCGVRELTSKPPTASPSMCRNNMYLS